MLNKIVIAALLVIILAGALIAVLSSHTSLWFMWGMLPGTNNRIAIDQTQSAGQRITQYISPHLLGDIQPYVSSAKRFSFSGADQNVKTYIVLPLRQQQNILLSQLINDNWRIQQYGRLIIAQQGEQAPVKKVSQAYKLLAQELAHIRRPLKPLFVADFSKGIDGLTEGRTALIGMIKGNEMTIIAGK